MANLPKYKPTIQELETINDNLVQLHIDYIHIRPNSDYVQENVREQVLYFIEQDGFIKIKLPLGFDDRDRQVWAGTHLLIKDYSSYKIRNINSRPMVVMVIKAFK